jgi:photosystem II stability/assembly factor-like uncharacterized protein
MRTAVLVLATTAIAACGGGGKGPGTGTGTGWTLVDSKQLGSYDIIVAGSRLVVAGGQGIVVSDDDGATWAPSNGGFAIATPVYDLVAVGSTILADAYDGLYASVDQGTTWARVPAVGLPTTASIYTSFVVGSDVLVGMNAPSTDVGISGTLFKTSDAGATFSASSSGLPQDEPVTAFATAGSAIYCAPKTGVGLSADGGATWQLNPLPTTSNVLQVATVAGTVLAGTADGILYTSADGVSWSLAGDGLPPSEPIDVLYTNAGKAYTSSPGGNGNPSGVYVSSDAGATWTPLNDGFDAVPPYVVAFAVKDGSMFAATELGGIWRRPL